MKWFGLMRAHYPKSLSHVMRYSSLMNNVMVMLSERKLGLPVIIHVR